MGNMMTHPDNLEPRDRKRQHTMDDLGAACDDAHHASKYRSGSGASVPQASGGLHPRRQHAPCSMRKLSFSSGLDLVPVRFVLAMCACLLARPLTSLRACFQGPHARG